SWERRTRGVRHNRASKFALANPDIEFAPSPVSSIAPAFGFLEIIRARVCLCARYLRDHRSRPPSETDPALRKRADECIQEQNRECRTLFLSRLFVPAREYCFRNRK